MNLIGLKVVHKIFKDGIITNVQNNKITVIFDDENLEKIFYYPNCFKNHLTIFDSVVLDEIKKDIIMIDETENKKREIERVKAENRRVEIQTKNVSKSNSRNIKETPLLRFSNLGDFCDYYTKQINLEILYLIKTGGKHITVYDGRFIEKNDKIFYYEFDTNTELNYPDGTPITMYIKVDSVMMIGTAETKGTLENCSEFTVLISTDIDLGHSKDTEISSLEFSVEGWRILKALNDKINLMREKINPIVEDLVTNSYLQIDYRNNIKTGQDNAVEMSLSQPITFIWGPPGTGKTETLAKISLKHMEKGRRILMLSYSNVSVDGAIQRVFKHYTNAKPGLILRYGYPKDEDINNSFYKSSFNYVLHTNDKLVNERKVIIEKIKNIKKTSNEYKEYKKRLSEIRKELAFLELKAIKNASFIATTVSKAIMDKNIHEIEFDVVIFDEASMSYIPQILFGAGLAKKHFICIGDFCQLPPIVQGDDSDSLNVDIFKYCGISDAVDRGCSHKWLCMLDVQYRMHPQIANIASSVMYHNLLKTSPQIEKKREEIQQSIPELAKAFGIADLSYMMSTCIPMKDNSRVNVLSAFISFALAQRAYSDFFDVGIISPYTTQTRLLSCMAKDQSEYYNDKKPIPCATVHQFQGSEKDVIVFDAVDCYRQTYPGVLLTGIKNNYANRLFNVAMTRAKGKFIAVTNAKFMIDKGVSPRLMFGQVIDKSRKESFISGNELSNLNLDDDSCIKFFTNNSAFDKFFEDIESAKKSIYIDIPDKPINDELFFEKLMSLIKLKESANIKVVVRAEKRANLPYVIKSTAIEHSYSMNPVAVIDKHITWYGMPLSKAVFKTENEVIATKYYPIIRFQGRKTAITIYGLLEMSNITDESIEIIEEEPKTLSQYIVKNIKCNICGKPMKMCKGKSGKFFLSCSAYPACTNTSYLTEELVESYLYSKKSGSDGLISGLKCVKCNMSLEAKIGPYGLYIQCCGLNKHKYKPNEI